LAPGLSFFAKRDKQTRELRPAVLGYLMLWMGWCFLFFSLSRCKLPAYILPAAPAFALLTGYYLDLVIFEKCRNACFRYSRWVMPWTASIVTCIAGLALGGVALGMRLDQPAAIAIKMVPWILILAGLLVLHRLARQPRVVWSICTLTGLLLVGQTTQDWVPRYGMEHEILVSSWELARSLQDPGQSVATYDNEWSGIPFYLGRNDVPNFVDTEISELVTFLAEHPNTILFVNQNEDLLELDESMPPGTELVKLCDRGSASLVMLRQQENEVRTAWRDKPLYK
jgi:dolichol-phosphate mannosyltransferase